VSTNGPPTSVLIDTTLLGSRIRHAAGDGVNRACLVARTNTLVDRYADRLEDRGTTIRRVRPNAADDPSKPGLRVATMHRVKGLEFGRMPNACMRDKASRRTLLVAPDFHHRRHRERVANSPEGRWQLRKRIVVEHAIGRMKNLGAGTARYSGQLETLVQWQWTAAVLNLTTAWAREAAVTAQQGRKGGSAPRELPTRYRGLDALGGRDGGDTPRPVRHRIAPCLRLRHRTQGPGGRLSGRPCISTWNDIASHSVHKNQIPERQPLGETDAGVQPVNNQWRQKDETSDMFALERGCRSGSSTDELPARLETSTGSLD